MRSPSPGERDSGPRTRRSAIGSARRGREIIKGLGDKQYEGWNKYSHTREFADGSRAEVHYNQNPATGEVGDVKIKTLPSLPPAKN